MSARAACVTLLLAALGVAGVTDHAGAQTIEVTPFTGYETSGSYPLPNPTTVQALAPRRLELTASSLTIA